MPLRQGVKAALPNTQKQTQRSCHIEEISERTNKTLEKRTRQNGDKQPMRCTVQNTGYQNASRTHWELQQHKKDPGRNEGCIK